MSIKDSYHEYDSLRAEQVSRIEAMYNMSSGAVTVLLTSLAAGLSLLAIYYFQDTITDICSLLWLGFFQSMLAIFPIIFMVPISVRSGENIQQITRISCYIRVFYEYQNKDLEKCLYWETATNRSRSLLNQRNKNKISFIFNEEYTILSVCSLFVYIFFCILSIQYCYTLLEKESSNLDVTSHISVNNTIYLINLLRIIFLLIAIVLVFYIHSKSSVKNNVHNLWNSYIQEFLMWGQCDKRLDLGNTDDEVKEEAFKRLRYYQMYKLPDNLQKILNEMNEEPG